MIRSAISGRISKQEMFMQMAEIAMQRSTCVRRRVGAVITDVAGTSVVSLGYNGNAKGLPNTCDSSIPGECGCIHAEMNALIKAPFHQGPLVMYTTTMPCPECAKLIINSAVTVVYYRDSYRSEEGVKLLRQAYIGAFVLPRPTVTPQLEL